MNPHRVTFLPMNVTATVAEGQTFAAKGQPGSLLSIALAHGVAIEHACGGVGICATCHVIVRQGMDNLSPPSDEELDCVELAPGNTVDSRLACQAVVHGDVTVEVPAWNRNLVRESE